MSASVRNRHFHHSSNEPPFFDGGHLCFRVFSSQEDSAEVEEEEDEEEDKEDEEGDKDEVASYGPHAAALGERRDV